MGESGDEHESPFDRPADLLFFTTLGCHLCEQAEQMLGSVAHSQRIELAVDVIDIADDAALVDNCLEVAISDFKCFIANKLAHQPVLFLVLWLSRGPLAEQ